MRIQKTMIILTGNIGSGKSTLCKKAMKNEYVIISRDSLRYGIGAGDYVFNKYYEPVLAKTVLFMCEEFLKKKVPVIIDEVNISKRSRKPYLKLAKKYGYDAVSLLFPRRSQEICVERRMQNPHGADRQTWELVWDMFNTAYKKPSLREGFKLIIPLKTKGDGYEICDEKVQTLQPEFQDNIKESSSGILHN